MLAALPSGGLEALEFTFEFREALAEPVSDSSCDRLPVCRSILNLDGEFIVSDSCIHVGVGRARNGIDQDNFLLLRSESSDFPRYDEMNYITLYLK